MNDDPPADLGQGPFISFGRRRIVAAVFGLLNVTMNAGCGLVVQRPNPPSPTSSISTTPFATPTATPSPSTTEELYAKFPPPKTDKGCKLVDDLPDLACTPGSVDTSVTQLNKDDTICTTGYTTSVRPPTSVTFVIEERAIQAYGLKGTPKDWILDHAVSLELGGRPYDKDESGRIARLQSNLFPQSRKASLEKDQVEDRLNALVCAGVIKLADAQRAIVNWREADIKYPESMLPEKTRPPRSTPPPTAKPKHYKSCAEAKRAGVAPMRRKDPGYERRLDRDRDGVACER